MSRLLERETSPPRIRTERTLYRLSCRGSSRKREKERETGEEGGRGQRRCFARFSSEKRIVFECSTNVSVFCLFDGVAWTVCGYRRGQNPSFTIFLTAIPAVSRSRGSHSLFLLSPSVSSTTSAFLLPALDSSPNREYRHLLPTFFHAD